MASFCFIMNLNDLSHSLNNTIGLQVIAKQSYKAMILSGSLHGYDKLGMNVL